MKQKIFSLFFCFFFYSSISAQQTYPGGVSGSTLWLEAIILGDSDTKANVDTDYFNFNQVVRRQELKESVFKNLLSGSYSFFAVFKSDTEEEIPIITLKKGKTEVLITNKEVISNADMLFKKVDSKKGIIVSFTTSSSKKGKKNNSIIIEDFFSEDKEGKQQLIEVIYFPRLLKTAERHKVETYLSLKYGLSLINETDYFDSANEKIWDYKENKTYSNRITGIGRDEKLNLHQMQSGNADKDGLYIGFGSIDTTNVHNKFKIEDRTFLLWGDNGSSNELTIDKKDKSRKIMKRIWKVQASSLVQQDSLLTQIRISKREMNLQKNENGQIYWLAINDAPDTKFDYALARYIKQFAEDEEFVYFNDIIWDEDNSGADLFTIITGPDLFVIAEPAYDCALTEPGKLDINIAGGKAPHKISLESGIFKKEYLATTNTYTIDNVPNGEYALLVTDSYNNSVKENLVFDGLEGIEASVAPQWYLNDNERVQITVDIDNKQSETLSFSWKKNDREISSEEDYTATEPGKYSVSISNKKGCSKELFFEVIKNAVNSGWSVYPNPTKKEQRFNISFNLEKESKVHLDINSLDGKSYINKDLGLIKEYVYSDTILTSGVYLITVNIDDKIESTKLVIQ